MCRRKKKRRPQTPKRNRNERKLRNKAKRRRREERWRDVIGEFGPQAKSCARKVRYPTHDDARACADKRYRLSGVEFRVYHCKYCQGWHLTKQTMEERIESIRRIKAGEVQLFEDTTDRGRP